MPPSSPPSTPTTSPSPLSPADRYLLNLYLSFNQNLAALALHPAAQHPSADGLGADYLTLLAWLDSPYIQAALAAHDRAEARALRAAAATALAAATLAALTLLLAKLNNLAWAFAID